MAIDGHAGAGAGTASAGFPPEVGPSTSVTPRRGGAADEGTRTGRPTQLLAAVFRLPLVAGSAARRHVATLAVMVAVVLLVVAWRVPPVGRRALAVRFGAEVGVRAAALIVLGAVGTVAVMTGGALVAVGLGVLLVRVVRRLARVPGTGAVHDPRRCHAARERASRRTRLADTARLAGRARPAERGVHSVRVAEPLPGPRLAARRGDHRGGRNGRGGQPPDGAGGGRAARLLGLDGSAVVEAPRRGGRRSPCSTCSRTARGSPSCGAITTPPWCTRRVRTWCEPTT